MIYITGDTHGGFQRFGSKYFPQQTQMGRNDYMIICGDFGGLCDKVNLPLRPRKERCSSG